MFMFLQPLLPIQSICHLNSFSVKPVLLLLEVLLVKKRCVHRSSLVFLVSQIGIRSTQYSKYLILELLLVGRSILKANSSQRMLDVIFLHYVDEFFLVVLVFVS